MLETERTCKDCGETLPIDAFPWHVMSRGFHLPRCRDCQNKRRRAYMAKRTAQMREAQAREEAE